MKSRFSILLVGSVLFLVAGCDKDGISSKDEFPHYTQEHVFLLHAGSDTASGAIRDVKFLPDGVTPVREVVTLPDDSEKEIFYRPDFKPWRVFEYFGPRGSKHLKSETVFAVDGSFQSHSLFRQDRTLKESGRRLLDGTYELFDYRDNGVAVLKRRLLSKDNVRTSEDAFSEAGKLVSRSEFSKRGASDVIVTLVFDQEGRALYRTTKTTETYWSGNQTEVFFPGTMKVQFDYQTRRDGSGGYIKQFNLNGELLCSWTIDETKMRIEVHTATNQHHMAYVQYWVRTDKINSGSREWNYELDAVSDHDYGVPEERSDAKWLTRLIEFDPGADRPSHMIIREPYSYSPAQTTQFLNQDGKVVKEEIVTESGDNLVGKTATRTIEPAADPVRPIDWSRMKYQPFEAHPSVDLPVIKVRSVRSTPF